MNGPLQEVQHCVAAAPWTRQGSSQAGLHITVPRLGTIAPKKVVGGWPPRSLLLLIKGLSRGNAPACLGRRESVRPTPRRHFRLIPTSPSWPLGRPGSNFVRDPCGFLSCSGS